MKLLPDDPTLRYTFAVIYTGLALVQPIWPVLITLGILVAADTLLGIWASKKRGVGFKSSLGWRVFTKLFIYQFVLVVLYFAETYVWKGWIPAVTLASGGVAVVEVASILENATTILGTPVFKFLQNKLDSKSKKD